MSISLSRTRLGAVALAVSGVLFLLYPATRPYEDESTLEGATAAMSSNAWVAAHLFGIVGFVLLSLGLLALYNCANPRYDRWLTDWPPLASALLTAAERTGAVLAATATLYG